MPNTLTLFFSRKFGSEDAEVGLTFVGFHRKITTVVNTYLEREREKNISEVIPTGNNLTSQS
jgi:hypothetical protein